MIIYYRKSLRIKKKINRVKSTKNERNINSRIKIVQLPVGKETKENNRKSSFIIGRT